MDFSSGIPLSARTLVVVPAMLTGARGIDDLVEALEVRYLANQDANLRYALLTDFSDAPEESLAGDAELLRLAEDGIGALNEKYATVRGVATEAGHDDIFFLLHRPRLWNARERVWMGYERKRGKLSDLNALLRGVAGAWGRFASIVGDPATLTGVQYVITLDTDTELPRDAARQLVGAMAHPPNRPRYDPKQERVTDGYGILQPRIATSLTGSNRSLYARLFGGESGIDPYTRAVSDVYQDGFGEGSFIGKGIYDVDAFEQSLRGRFPENRILSHDLLEGSYAALGTHYRRAVVRRLSVPLQRRREPPSPLDPRRLADRGMAAPQGSRRRRNARPQCALAAVAMEDLRQSAAESGPAGVDAASAAGMDGLTPPGAWTLAVLGVLVLPAMIASLVDLVQKPNDVPLRQHLAFTARTAARHASQLAFSLACLPYEAWFHVDAIVRTHWRMLFSRRRLLEWIPSSEQDRRDRTTLGASLAAMWIAPTVAVTTGAFLLTRIPAALPVAIPFLLLWLVSPVLTWWMSRPITRHAAKLAPEQIDFLRKLARRTWAYFETFVAASEHWLPPDNYQEVPIGTVAHRTSPTNMGMALLADLAAYDFGYLPAGRLVERLTTRSTRCNRSSATGTLLQLVRHAVAGAAVPAVHFFGRQRKPRRASADAARRTAGFGWSPDYRIADFCGARRYRARAPGIARRRCSDGGRGACPRSRFRLRRPAAERGGRAPLARPAFRRRRGGRCLFRHSTERCSRTGHGERSACVGAGALSPM
jgi:hypothetical protein